MTSIRSLAGGGSGNKHPDVSVENSKKRHDCFPWRRAGPDDRRSGSSGADSHGPAHQPRISTGRPHL